MTKAAKSFIARVENLSAANDFVEGCAGFSLLAGKKQFGVKLALEEAFVNICKYAYPESESEPEGSLDLSCGIEGDAFVLAIADSGAPFDVLSLPAPDLSLGVMERQVGGLGVHFIRNVSDAVCYRRENERNILRMEFMLPKKDNR